MKSVVPEVIFAWPIAQYSASSGVTQLWRTVTFQGPSSGRRVDFTVGSAQEWFSSCRSVPEHVVLKPGVFEVAGEKMLK